MLGCRPFVSLYGPCRGEDHATGQTGPTIHREIGQWLYPPALEAGYREFKSHSLDHSAGNIIWAGRARGGGPPPHKDPRVCESQRGAATLAVALLR